MSVALLAALAWWLDAEAIAARFVDLDAGWALLALAVSLPQMALLALRWRITAGRLGIDLPFETAVREYYLGVFLNQVLPGGVMGDASRAWRHARGSGGAGAPASRLGPAVRAVILERASGQLVMGVVAAASLAVMPLAFGAAPRVLLLAAAGAGGALVLGLVLARRRAKSSGLMASLWRDVHTALLARDVVWTQACLSLLVTASYLATYLAAARAVGVDTPFWALLPLVPPVLVSMLLPVTVAGWGVREATAAALWGAVGLTAVDGVSISAAYGLIVLVASLPGAAVLLSAGRGRRAGPRSDGSGGSGDAGRPRGSRPPPPSA